MFDHAAVQDMRRQAPRHQVDSISCPLGKIMDLSTGGMRIACKGKPPVRIGQVGSVDLRCSGGKMTLAAQVVWTRRSGFRDHEIGLKFVNLTRAHEKALDSLGRFGFLVPPDRCAREAADHHHRRQSSPMQAAFDVPDYYAVLNLQPGAEEHEIKKAYRALARKYHPDVSGDPEHYERFVAITEAFEVLTDPQRRRTFDESRGVQPPSP